MSDLSPQRVLQSLPGSRELGVTVSILSQTLKLSGSQSNQLLVFLKEFVRHGLAGTKGGRYWRRQTTGFVIGTLRGTRSGHAFVVPEDRKERDRGDLFVNVRAMGSGLNGDTVIARVTGVSDRGREGRVETVLHYANDTIVGVFAKRGPDCIASPIDQRFFYDVRIPPSRSLNAREGDVVNVEITTPPMSGRPPSGEVIEVLGPPDRPGIDLEIIIRKYHLPHVFPEGVLIEANSIGDEITVDHLKGREDLRDVLTVTIDGETARDFDDAVSLEQLPNGRLRLGVHIADVSFFVSEETELDEEAFRRGTSVYFPERAIPMLPERLSNDICSLKPNVDRLTMSAIIELNRNGRVVDYRLTPSVIHSRERMTYTAVHEIIANPDGETGREYAHVREMLLKMHELTNVLIKRREERGAIDFDLPEAELWFDDEGQIFPAQWDPKLGIHVT